MSNSENTAVVTAPKTPTKGKSKHVDTPAVEKPRTFTQVLAQFVENIPNELRKLTSETCELIHGEQVKMVESALAIGAKLREYRNIAGAEIFSTFSRTVLPAMGISQKTAYRYIGKAVALESAIGNKALRNALMLLANNGDALVVEDNKTDDNGNITERGFKLSDHVADALKSVKRIPNKPSEIESLARNVLESANKARQQARTTGNGTRIEQRRKSLSKSVRGFFKSAAIGAGRKLTIDMWAAFIAQYGTDESAKLLATLDKMATATTVEETKAAKAS